MKKSAMSSLFLMSLLTLDASAGTFGSYAISGEDGTAALPSYAFTNSISTGIFRGGADIWAVSTAGVERMRINATGQLSVSNTIQSTSGGFVFPDASTQTVAAILPSGIMLPFAGAAAPSGWLLCDGSAVNRVTFANLFAAIGVTWGAGDGVTTFNVPDLRGRAVVGVGTGVGLTNRALGATGGEESHTLIVAEMPSHDHGAATTGGAALAHTHAITDTGHTHTGTTDSDGAHTHSTSFTRSTGFVGANFAQGDATGTVTAGISTDSQGAHTHTFTSANNTTGIVNQNSASLTHDHTIPAQGGDGGHNTMMPFAAATYIIKQ